MPRPRLFGSLPRRFLHAGIMKGRIKLFVFDTGRYPAASMRAAADIRAEIAQEKHGLAASPACTTAMEAARNLLEHYKSDITTPILSCLEEGMRLQDKETRHCCQNILALQKELKDNRWQ